MSLPPLRFHNIHGRRVVHNDERTEARNLDEEELQLAFSDRPLVLDELVCLRLTTQLWPLPQLTFGVTGQNPASIINAVRNRTFKPILLDIHLERPNLFITLTHSGELHFWGEDGGHTRCMTGLDVETSYWLVVLIPSLPDSVEFVEGRTSQQPPCGYIYNLRPFYFHEIHGRNVKVLGQQVYCRRRSGKSRKGATFTSRPVNLNEKVCLRIYGINKTTDIQIGFTNQDPSTFARKKSKQVHRKLFKENFYWLRLLENNLYRNSMNIHFYVNFSRQIIYGVDGQTCGSIPSGLETHLPMWGIIVISGRYANIGFANAEFVPRDAFEPLIDEEICSVIQSLAVGDFSVRKIYSSPSQNSTSSTTPLDGRSSECSICNDSQTNAVFLPCSHMCACYQCALKLCDSNSNRQCPMCRQIIVNILRIYPC